MKYTLIYPAIFAALAGACGGPEVVGEHAAPLSASELPSEAVVRHFFPQDVWMHDDDSCPAPAGPSKPAKWVGSDPARTTVPAPIIGTQTDQERAKASAQ